MENKMTQKPSVLILGVTGQLGKLVADRLKNDENISLRVCSRRHDDLPTLNDKYGEAVHLDLDDPRTFDAALEGVGTLFLLTGYSVAMLVQSKSIVDAAKRAGIKHIVHVGVFSVDENCYDAHIAWHQMVEVYIKHSGVAWTFLHPNCFMQNFTGFYGMVKDGQVKFYSEDKTLGWIALEDVAEATAKILSNTSEHAGKDYWFSTESANISELASIFSEVSGEPFSADPKSPDEFIKDMGIERSKLDPYFFGVEDCFKQIVDGRMSYIGDVRDDLPMLIGRKGMSIRDWTILHKSEFKALAKKQ
jgi:NAD(P)H dehydrogenase (quinone)